MALSFKKTAQKILASQEFSKGTDADRERILIELMFITFDSTRLALVRRYGKCKFFNTVAIKSELNRVDIPDLNFDIR